MQAASRHRTQTVMSNERQDADEIGYLQRQSYLRPHPKELMLRNHV